MTNEEEVKRRIAVSAQISDSVYEFEKHETMVGNIKNLPKEEYLVKLENVMSKAKMPLPSGTHLVDYHYDERLGVAAIAVADDVTGETYIAYAGTNAGADGTKDIISDAAIGFNHTLYLNELETSAVAFYERVQSTGANITVTTGHSYGDFLATRVAIVEQTPYKFGYQGAPQAVSVATYYEVNYNLLLLSGVYTKEELDLKLKTAREEDERVKELIDNYSGYAVTFATTADALTNGLWNQGVHEVNFGGDVVLKGINLDIPAAWLRGKLSELFRTNLNPKYVGQVVAIDVPIEHDMTAYKNSIEAMYYTMVTVTSRLTGVDFNKDGNQDFIMSPEYTTTAPIIPNRARVGGGTRIQLDSGVLKAIATNLRSISSQLYDLLSLGYQAIESNRQVIERVYQRQDDYKRTISDYLESISLIQAVRDIDEAYNQIVDLEAPLSTISNYDTYSFARRFDSWGSSALYYWYKGDGSPWNYASVTGSLQNLTFRAQILKQIAQNNSTVGGRNNGRLIVLNTRTNVAQRGEKLINSYEEEIETVTKGLGNRSRFSDGIPLAVEEILSVIQQNLETVLQCVDYTVEVVETIQATMTAVDADLAGNLKNLDLSHIVPPQVQIASDYQTFLTTTGIFDDLTVVKAYDDQVDKKSEELATRMSRAFSDYLSDVSTEISSTISSLSSMSNQCDRVISKMATNIYYKKWGEKEKHFYGNVGSFIEISPSIRSIKSDLARIDYSLTTAATTINTTVGYLGNLYEPFRKGAEEAIYGMNDLGEVIKSQSVIHQILTALRVRFTSMKEFLESNEGVAVEALGSKMAEIVSLISNVEFVIGDAFGD